ncbi:MAG: NADH:ubiquinone oxidoreductase subunit NDUFA12 [Alphaproteobacteria bacterium]|nr:NADH:ubiquinone oxidoreductase subunit NDUFA12 [Alphaproteobacteria bacterium]
MGLLTSIFTWWSEPTFAARFLAWRRGEPVGTDQFGNRYFRDRRSDRRWVLYNGEVEGSRVPPEWNAWLQHTVEEVPGPVHRHPWQLEHEPNRTGSPAAYRPPGSLLAEGRRAAATGDYEPWQPG